MGWFINELFKVKMQTNVVNFSVRTLFSFSCNLILLNAAIEL